VHPTNVLTTRTLEEVLEFMEIYIVPGLFNEHMCVTDRPEADILTICQPLTPYRLPFDALKETK
jgi:hypothetical protein